MVDTIRPRPKWCGLCLISTQIFPDTDSIRIDEQVIGMLYRTLRRFWRESSGAVSLDWVVLTAGVAGFGLATYSLIDPGMNGLGTMIADLLGATSTDPSLGECDATGPMADLTDTALRTALAQAQADRDGAAAQQATCEIARRGLN